MLALSNPAHSTYLVMKTIYHEVLGVTEYATRDEIKKRFKELALIHHPDKGGNEDKFKEISNAYTELMKTAPAEKKPEQNPFSNYNDVFGKGGTYTNPNQQQQYQNSFWEFVRVQEELLKQKKEMVRVQFRYAFGFNPSDMVINEIISKSKIV